MHVLAGDQMQFMAFHTSYEDAWNAHYRDLAWSTSTTSTPRSWVESDRRIAARDPQQGLRRRDGCRVGEGRANLGQHEIGLSHGDALTIADNHAVFKTMAKEIAAQHGKAITFMAKYDEDRATPVISISLRGTEVTVFWGDHGRTKVFESFVAGLLATLYDFTLLRAEHQLLQAFRRRIAGADDDRVGQDDRCAVRLLGQEESARLENRVQVGTSIPISPSRR